jgi:PAS domain S-box-containing protein
MSSDQKIAASSIFVKGSAMADLMCEYDWSRTPLGEPSGWSQSLKTVLSILLTSQHPIFLWWGEDLIQFYNDAYRPILGTTKHPQALGQQGRECWQEIWHIIAPTIEAVMQRGEAMRIQDGLLLLERNGYLEECYFNYAYSPIRDEAGEVGGIFCACDETTKRVVGERQLKTLRELAAQPLGAQTVREAGELCMSAIAKNPADIPLALLYLMDDAGDKSARLVGTAGIAAGTSASPERIDLVTHPWNLYQVQRTEEAEYIPDLAARFDSLPDTIWGVPPQSAIVLPLERSRQPQISGFLILAISPRRAFNEDDRGFLEVVASQVETAIGNARAHEEERQRIEALAALDRAKTEFFSNISHEFRTPLTLMLSPLADTIANLDGSIPPQEIERLELIQRNSNRLLKLVNSLLDFSRLEAGKERVTYEAVDLASYTTELASTFRSTIEQAGLSLIVECPPLPAAVWLDRQMWEKIVLNLLSNAFKFTLAGTISVRLEWCGDRVELTVSDTGVGIPEPELPRLFDRFHRVENSQGRSFEGSGIGLSLVQELVKLQGGKVSVTSTLGVGSSFVVTIPTGRDRVSPIDNSTPTTITPIDPLPYVEEARRWLPENELKLPIGELGMSVNSLPLPPSQTPPSDRATILLADDNADMHDYIRRLLSGSYHVETATDGVAAMESIYRQPPDLVLTDVMMPKMDGFELLRVLRASAATADIPIILLSARAGEEARIEGLEAGADDYIIKPFSARELVARVEATLKLAQLRRTNRDRELVLEQETETARANLDRIVSSLRDGFATFDRQWRYTYVNNRLLEIINLPIESVIGQYSWQVFPHQVGIEFYDLLDRAMSEQIEVQFEFYYSFADCWVEHRVYPTTDGVAILMADISDRKRAELLLVEQKRLLELVASGEPLYNCLAAVCASVSNLSLGVRACILPTDAHRQKFPYLITPEFPPSFATGLHDTPINDLLGTCAIAVDTGQTVTCADISEDECRSPAWRDLCVAHGVMGCHSAPIVGADDLPLGALLLCFDRPRLPTEWEYQLAKFGTNIASIVFDRERASLALQTSETKYRKLFESMDEGLCICQMLFDENGVQNDYRFLEVNSAFGNLTGLEGAAGKTVRELVPDLEAHWFEIYGRVVQTGEPIRFEERSIAMNRWFNVNAFATGDPGSNQFAILFTNITERKLIERERERFLTVGADLQVIADRHGQFQWVSPTLERVLGWTQAEMLSCAWTDLIHPDDLPGSSVEAENLFSEHVTMAYESRYRHKDGSYRWFLWNARGYPSRLYPAERVLYAAAVDITDRKQAEEALRESETRMRFMLNATQIGQWDLDLTTQPHTATRSLRHEQIFGYESLLPEWSYEIFLPHVHPQDRAAVDEKFQQTLSTNADWNFECRIIHPDGSIHWIWSRSSVYCDADGKPTRLLGMVMDFTDRKQTEIALQESEERLRVSQLAAKIGTWDWDVAAGSVIWSPEYYALYGQDPSTPATYENWLAAVLPADREPAEQAFQAALAQQQTYLDFEFRIVHPTQGIRWFSSRSQIFYDVDGKPLRAIGISIDVTDRKQVEEALRQSEQRFRNMADNAPMMVWVTDETGYCNYLSRSWYEFTGQTETEGLGLGWLGVAHPDDREFTRDIFLSAKERHEAFQLEYRLLHQDGAYRTCIDAGRPWFGSKGEFKGYIGSVIDIDERKQIEAILAARARELADLNSRLAQTANQLKERNQELDSFVHIVSHDLKAPLRAIANLSEWIEEDLEGISTHTTEQMNLLRSRVHRMQSTIDGLLEYARVGHQDSQLELVSVADLLAEVIESIAPPPTFEMSIATEMPTLETKRLLLFQVFANLISNAFKHHDRPDGSIRVSCRTQGDFYEFAVADDGPGIPPESRDRIFIIFQAANPQKNPDSTGVGLSIVKKIVETAGGHIWLESELGKGTTFYFTWPMRGSGG